MTTQTLQDIVGHEPHHWRGDRLGLEEFNPAFVGLNGRDATLTPTEMQQFESFLATITIPPNPFRNFDNTLPTALPLTGHTTTGRFLPAGQPLGIGNAQNGMTLYRSTARRLDGGAFACVTCHTLPTGTGTDRTFSGGQFQPIPPGPNGERHHQVVSVDGSTNRTIKVPQLRNLYEKVGFTAIGTSSRAGFGVLHDGSVDTIERFVAEPAFTVQNDQEIADIVAFMLAFSGSDLPAGTTNNILIPVGTASKDTHAAVGKQTTVLDGTSVPPVQNALINSMLALANANKVALIARGRSAGLSRGFLYIGGDEWQSDRAAETLTGAELRLLAAPGSELTYTVVPNGTQVRMGIDRDADGYFDRDELDACSDPADPTIIPGGPGSGLPGDLDGDGEVGQGDLALLLSCYAEPGATCGDIDGDNDTDQGDLAALLANYGASCPE